MILKKEDIEKMLVFMDNKDEFYFEKLPLKWKKRSLAQNNTFYKCFDTIWNKMWIPSEEVKQNCLKALFWISKSKFGWIVYENAIKPRTSDLNVQEATLLIETLIEFWKKLWCREIITSRELQTLFYNN